MSTLPLPYLHPPVKPPKTHTTTAKSTGKRKMLAFKLPHLFTPLHFPPLLLLHRPQTLTLTPSKTLILSPKSSSSSSSSASPYAPDEMPVDEEFLAQFSPKERESEEDARRRNWIDRGWAPWEEILTPEADFARKSLNEGEEVPLQNPEALEAFRMLSPSYRRKKMEESGLSEDEYFAKQFAIKGEIPDPLTTTWDSHLAVRMVPPRDWPPRGWEVDAEELAFLREAHVMQAERVDLEEGEKVEMGKEEMCLDRYKVFLKQYKEWAEANRDRLEEESYKVVFFP